MKNLTLIFLVMSLVGAGCAMKKERAAPFPPNRTIEAQIKNKLENDPLTAPWDVRVKAEGNKVTLTGLVDREEERRRAEDLARAVVGELRKVENQLLLTQEVILDNSIVAKLKTDLLTDPTTRLIPIDVQSHKGKVTLRGSVKTDEQSRQAEALARNTSGVVAVDNRLKVSG